MTLTTFRPKPQSRDQAVEEENKELPEHEFFEDDKNFKQEGFHGMLPRACFYNPLTFISFG